MNSIKPLLIFLFFVLCFSSLLAEESKITYVVVTSHQNHLEVSIDGQNVALANHFEKLQKAFVAAGGHGAKASLLLGPKCTLADVWNFKGLLGKIGYEVRVYSLSGEYMTELISGSARELVPDAARPK